MTDQKAKFRDGLKRFVEKEHFKEKEGNLSDVQRSEGLALFYFSKVFDKLNPGVLSDDIEEISSYIVDGKNDQGVDVIFSQDNHHYLIQCKYRGQKKTESDKEVLDFMQIFKRIHPEVGSDFEKNQKVLDAIADIDWKQDTFSLIFISLSRENQDIRNYENQGIDPIDHNDLRDIDDRASFRFMSEDDLNMEYRDSLQKRVLVNATLNATQDQVGNYWYLHENEENYRSFITTISASQIHSLYQRKREALFNLNIRNFIGDTSTNKKIVETVGEEPENFFFYNNGISAIASKVKENPETGQLDCESFSIINGAQTFKSVSKAYARSRSKSKDVKNLSVMMRLTETPDLFTKTDFIERIIQYNNTQNAVKISDFRSNDGVQTALADYFSKIAFGGKRYHYKNKRTHGHPKNSIPISLDDFCRAIHSFDKGPIDCFGGVKYLYDTNKKDGGYYFLFGDKENNQILETISQSQFDIFASKFFICETARILFGEQKKDRIANEESRQTPEDKSSIPPKPIFSKRALQGRHLILFTVGEILREIALRSGKNIDDFLKATGFNKPTWRDDQKKYKLIEDAVRLSCDVLIRDYKNRQNPDFVHINWFREQDTLRRLHEDIKLANDSSIQNMYDSFSA